ncbi:ParB/RepB/Spo0J family partition protein [Patescibacteria group bacterium]|nr:ParB/RepB/Spo0J family partition protein [Patescibacteria group bacterium]
MAVGNGLSSLIPKKNEPGAPAPAHQVPVSAPQEERPYFTQNVRPNAMPAHQPENSRPQPVSQHHVSPQAPKPQRSGEMIYQLETEKIHPNPYQPRAEFSDEGLQELAASIREFGILQPLVVSKATKETDTGADVEYQLIAGERRLRAAKMIGLERVPAIVRQADGPRHKLEMALIENIQRQNLNPVETARAYSRLQDEFNLTQREIAVRVGKSREAVANTLRLLNLPSAVQSALSEGKINESQARTLLGIASPEEQYRVFQNILAGKMTTVRAVKGEVEKTRALDPESSYWAKRFEDNLGSPVKVSKDGSKGRITVDFNSDGEWQTLTEKLGGPAE